MLLLPLSLSAFKMSRHRDATQPRGNPQEPSMFQGGREEREESRISDEILATRCGATGSREGACGWRALRARLEVDAWGRYQGGKDTMRKPGTPPGGEGQMPCCGVSVWFTKTRVGTPRWRCGRPPVLSPPSLSEPFLPPQPFPDVTLCSQVCCFFRKQCVSNYIPRRGHVTGTLWRESQGSTKRQRAGFLGSKRAALEAFLVTHAGDSGVRAPGNMAAAPGELRGLPSTPCDGFFFTGYPRGGKWGGAGRRGWAAGDGMTWPPE